VVVTAVVDIYLSNLCSVTAVLHHLMATSQGDPGLTGLFLIHSTGANIFSLLPISVVPNENRK